METLGTGSLLRCASAVINLSWSLMARPGQSNSVSDIGLWWAAEIIQADPEPPAST